jgi:hypothetical protein
MTMTAAYFMREEILATIKAQIVEQSVNRLIQYHLGQYELEEGEIIDVEWSAEDLQATAEIIMLRE